MKVVWIREEDAQHGVYKPYFCDRLAAGLDEQGMPIAWSHRLTGSSVMARMVPPAFKNGQESLGLFAGAHDNLGIISNVADLARVAAARGHPSVVIRLLAAVDALSRAGALPCPDADRNACDRAVAAARGQLDAATGDAAWSEGAAMTLEQTVAHARTQVGDLPST